MATTAPPVVSKFSTPVTVDLRPCSRHTRRAVWMTVPYTGSTAVSVMRPGCGSYGAVQKGPLVTVPAYPLLVPTVVAAIAAGREVAAVWVNKHLRGGLGSQPRVRQDHNACVVTPGGTSRSRGGGTSRLWGPARRGGWAALGRRLCFGGTRAW